MPKIPVYNLPKFSTPRHSGYHKYAVNKKYKPRRHKQKYKKVVEPEYGEAIAHLMSIQHEEW